ncbi:UNVERIFIED_CONTAM: hypothetical protein Sindi_1998400 [Sesamum indicum]
MAQFVAQQPANPPLPSPCRNRELSSAPKKEEQRREEVNSRIFRPKVAQTQDRNLHNQESSALLPPRGAEDSYLMLAMAPPRRCPFAPNILAEALLTGLKPRAVGSTFFAPLLYEQKGPENGGISIYYSPEGSRDPERLHAKGSKPQPRDSTSNQTGNGDNLPTVGVIAVISGGPAGGDSINARRALARAARGSHAQTPIQVHNIGSQQEDEISFGQQYFDPMRNQNNDTLVISATISNFWVKKILVDSGSSADIIFHEAYVQLGIDNAQLRKVNTPLTGFSGDMIQPVGEVTLPLSLGSYPKRSTKLVKFLVVKAPSSYNVILGRPSLNLFRAIASTFHLKLKFPTPDGVGEVVGDERMVRECYANALKRSREKMNEATDEKMKRNMTDGRRETTDPPEEYVRAPSGEKIVEAVEELKPIHLSIDGEKTLKIGTTMCQSTEESLTRFLTENEEVFAWSMMDFYGIPPGIITHQLNVNPEAKPV